MKTLRLVEATTAKELINWLLANDNGGNLLPLFANYRVDRNVLGEFNPIRENISEFNYPAEYIKEWSSVKALGVALAVHSLRFSVDKKLFAEIEVLDMPSDRLLQKCFDQDIAFRCTVRALLLGDNRVSLIAVDVVDINQDKHQGAVIDLTIKQAC